MLSESHWHSAFVAVPTKCNKTSTKTTESQYFPVNLEQDRLPNNLLCGWHLGLELASFQKQKNNKAYDHFHCPYGKILTKKGLTGVPGFTSIKVGITNL